MENLVAGQEERMRKKVFRKILYVIKVIGQDIYKIGISTDSKSFNKRFDNLNCQSHLDLERKHIFYVYDAAIYELFLHFYFRDFIIKNEWFSLNNDQVEFISKTCCKNMHDVADEYKRFFINR
jgi:hypothetical protein